MLLTDRLVEQEYAPQISSDCFIHRASGYRSIRLLVTTVAVVQPHAGVELSGGQGQVYAHRQQYAVSAQYT